jgi:hypothetical protein
MVDPESGLYLSLSVIGMMKTDELMLRETHIFF